MCILGRIFLFLAEIVEIDVAEAGTKNERNLLFALQLCFLHLLHLFAFCWHTGDNVRLSDVVKLLIVCKTIIMSAFSARKFRLQLFNRLQDDYC